MGNVLKQLRGEQLRKRERVKNLKKLRVESMVAHKRLLEVSKLGPKREGRVQHRESKLLPAFEREQEWRTGLLLRVKKVRRSIKDAVKKLFVLSHAEGQLRRSMARLRGVALSKARGFSRLSSRLNLWSYRRQKSAQELLHESNKLVSELSRRNQMSRKLKKLKAQRVGEGRLLRRLKIDSADHAKELLRRWGSKTELAIARGRLASDIGRQHLRWSIMFQDLQKIKTVVAALTKKVERQHESHVQAKELHTVWRRMKKERYVEAHLRRVLATRGVLHRHLKRALAEVTIQYEKSMMLVRKLQKRMRYMLHQLKSSRMVVWHLHKEMQAMERGNMVGREMLKTRKTLSARAALGRKLFERVKETRWFLMETLVKTAKTISELRRLRKIEMKVIASLKQTGSVRVGNARMARLIKDWIERRRKLALVLEKDKIAMGRGIEHIKAEMERQKRGLDDLKRRQRKLTQGLRSGERSVLWAHKELKKQAKKLNLMRRYSTRSVSVLKGLHGRRSINKRAFEEMQIRDGHLRKELQKMLAEIGEVERQVAAEKERATGAAHLAHLKISHVEMQLRRGRH